MSTSNQYIFQTNWRLNAKVADIYAVLSDADDLVRWWPAVYLDVKTLRTGDAYGVGKVVSLFTKGWLPYTLRWQFVVTEMQYPAGFALRASGDFEGHGRWTFEQVGEQTLVRYDWQVVANKPLLRTFSFIMKPIFAANHHWAMATGLTSLQCELERRQGKATPTPPPQPTFRWLVRGAADSTIKTG